MQQCWLEPDLAYEMADAFFRMLYDPMRRSVQASARRNALDGVVCRMYVRLSALCRCARLTK
ncbi:hypothetical protein BMW22_25715 (plasmid) [Rhizobium leguminosarum]|nr:hypothetical protein [Rhizobium leguminosarum bv. viciae]ANP90849.1 hypothetical protein BA011_33540 [Rhizobium leguminosarum]API55043.1 hypothetical protein BMW22_25715 [Rhizobium leguminosarum]KZB02890.1 hypothetical protein A4A59_08490 [Rhizobium leguminosarum]